MPIGSAIECPEQLNFAQYNQGMSSNQKFYNKTPQNSLDDKHHHPVMQTTKESLKSPPWNFC